MPAIDPEKTEQVPRVSAADPQVVLHPEDNDLMVRTGRQVIAACQLNISIELWLHELEAMYSQIRDWAKSTAGINTIHVAPRGGKIAIFISPETETFDFDLADAHAKLRSHLVKNFNVGMVEILQIPSKELDRFVDGGRVRSLYVKPAGSHSSVEA